MSIFKKYGKNIDNPSIRICTNKIVNRITFKIKTGYYLELLTIETMKLLRNTENKVTKDKRCVTGVVLVHCNIVNNDYQQN